MAGWYGTYSVIVCYGGGYSWCCSEWAWRTLTRMSVPRTRPEPNPNPTRTRLEHDPYPIQTRPELDFSFATALMLWWFKLDLASSCCCCLTFTIHWRDDAYPNTNSFWRKGEPVGLLMLHYRNNKSTQHDEALQGEKLNGIPNWARKWRSFSQFSVSYPWIIWPFFWIFWNSKRLIW